MNNHEQIAYWNGDGGRKWAERDELMAGVLAPISEALLTRVAPRRARTALDVGCGGGSNTLQLLQHLDNPTHILGIDVSAPLLEVARARVAERGTAPLQTAPLRPAPPRPAPLRPAPTRTAPPRIEFLRADAATHDFGDWRFDVLFSRFGVMFFDDPVAAFAQLRRAAHRNAGLAFCCWQALDNNPWTALPLKAALTVLPAPEPVAPHSPGPFAFADAAYVREVLAQAGWSDTRIEPYAPTLEFSIEGGYEAAVRELVNTGPVGRLLAPAERPAREAVYAAARRALKDYYRGDTLALAGAVWFVTAVNTV